MHLISGPWIPITAAAILLFGSSNLKISLEQITFHHSLDSEYNYLNSQQIRKFHPISFFNIDLLCHLKDVRTEKCFNIINSHHSQSCGSNTIQWAWSTTLNDVTQWNPSAVKWSFCFLLKYFTHNFRTVCVTAEFISQNEYALVFYLPKNDSSSD